MSPVSPISPELNNSSAQNQPHSPGAAPTPRGTTDNTNVPKPKRLACLICRKRKLKCDGGKPSCSTCARLGHPCAYDEVRRKSGPKRGYVKALEERLKYLETLLSKTQASPLSGTGPPIKPISPALDTGAATRGQVPPVASPLGVTDTSLAIPGDRNIDRWRFNGESPQPQSNAAVDEFNFGANMSMGMGSVGGNFTWEMVGLGLEEPLPPQETIDELHQIYFEKVHPSLPMIHKYRYLAAMNLAPNQRPPVALRYAIWMSACSITEKYVDLKDLFYQRSRKYIEADYIKGYGEHMISVAHAQTHVLLASYEFRMMIGLHRLDGAGLDVKQSLPPPRDWTEREERRRTFWMAFCQDRYASIGTGWPMTIDEKDVMTNLPSSDEAFEMSRPEQTQSLQDCMMPGGASKLSSFGGIVLMACLFGRNLIHLHRPDPDDRDNDLNGEFWKRHRSMDNILLTTSLCLPPHLKLPAGLGDPNIVFTHMSIHTSTICLHQAAIFKADKNKLPASVSGESKARCVAAANEIASTMRMISHMDLSSMNPFISFCLYVAARVLVQYLKSSPDDSQTADTLWFLLSAMGALKRRNPLTESFLVQLDVDLEALGMRIPRLRSAFPRSGDSPSLNTGAKLCDGPNGVAGILSCRGEFTKPTDNDAHVPPAPDIMGNPGPQPSSDSQSRSYTGQKWLPTDPALSHEQSTGTAALPMQGIILTPGSGSMYDKGASSSGQMPGFGHGEGSGEKSTTSPDGGLSRRPTPNSSSTAEQRCGTTASATESRIGRDLFQASRTLDAQDASNRSIAEAHGQSFFGDPRGFGLGTSGLAPGQRFAVGGTQVEGFGLSPGSWGGMAGQGGVTPMGEGVLRSLMNMGPMDAMDLPSWNSSS
ncbi:hypothetical protein ACRALDRAFT_1034169 [Sodiomyces alcalophilus JCM 7366]|uniref:uncharacterized protein n=1 Tax=Sodiomyces alcalophilus JCM 7366 TaxID=591952 RepID=UPI0039B5CA9B